MDGSRLLSSHKVCRPPSSIPPSVGHSCVRGRGAALCCVEGWRRRAGDGDADRIPPLGGRGLGAGDRAGERRSASAWSDGTRKIRNGGPGDEQADKI